jgi:hypothetical protein
MSEAVRSLSPDFFIIGAQKCGSTWLHEQLRHHVETWLPADKDPDIDLLTSAACQRLIDRQQQSPKGAVKLRGDSNAAYFWSSRHYLNELNTATAKHGHFNANIASCVKRCLGNRLKLMVLLRDPVERAVSAYLHHISMGSLSPSVPLLDTPPELGIVSMGYYYQHLQSWLQVYAADNMLILPTPSASNASLILNAVSEFLGITPFVKFDSSKVFAGLPRHQDEKGIWVDLSNPVFDRHLLNQDVEIRSIHGSRHACLINRAVLNRLRAGYFEDTQALSEVIQRHFSRSVFDGSAWLP